jgi:hypothetical protein
VNSARPIRNLSLLTRCSFRFQFATSWDKNCQEQQRHLPDRGLYPRRYVPSKWCHKITTSLLLGRGATESLGYCSLQYYPLIIDKTCGLGKQKFSEKILASDTLFNSNPIRTAPQSNPGIPGEKSTTYRMIHIRLTGGLPAT